MSGETKFHVSSPQLILVRQSVPHLLVSLRIKKTTENMRLSTIALALQVGTTYAAFAPTTTFSTDMKLLATAAAEEEDDGKVTVRFINYNRAGETAVKHVDKGTNVLNVADSAGVHIPRNCRSGLCGSCTADMIDPSWTVGHENMFAYNNIYKS